MIGYLRGTVLFRNEDSVVLDCGGVGYEVFPTREAMEALPMEGGEGAMFIYTLVREDEIALFGFLSREEQKLFELLYSVSGVGPKTAVTILSGVGSDPLIQAVATENPLPLTRVKGIGKRTAERIILELKDKITKVYAATITTQVTRSGGLTPRLREAEEALVLLGYRRPDIEKTLHSLPRRDELTVEDLIREALSRLR